MLRLPKGYSSDFRLSGKKPIGGVEVDKSSKYVLESCLFINSHLYDLVNNKSLTPLLDRTGNSITHEGLKCTNGSAQFPITLSTKTEKTVVVIGRAVNASDATITAVTGSGEATSVNITQSSIAIRLGGFSASIIPPRTLDDKEEIAVVIRCFNTDWVSYAFSLRDSLYLGSSTRLDGGDVGFATSSLWAVGNPSTGFGRQGLLSCVYSMPYDIGESLAFDIGRNPYQILKPKSAPLLFTASGAGGAISVTETSQTLNITSQDPGIAFTGSISITESVSTLDLTSNNPVIDFTATLTVQESSSTLNVSTHNPAITLTATLTIEESVGIINLTGLDPTVTLTPPDTLAITESSQTINITGYDPIITLSGTLTIEETAQTINFTVRNPVIQIGAREYTQVFVGIEKDYEFTGTIKQYDFAGIITEAQIFSGTTKAATFLGATK